MQNTEPTIIVFHEKHGGRYFMANNQDEMEAIAVHIVLERKKRDWYYFMHEDGIPPLPKVPLEDATEEKFGKDIVRRIQQEWRQYNNSLREYNTGQKEKETLDRIKGGYNSPEIRKLALKFLYSHRDYEYEGFDVETPEEYKKDFEA